MDSVQVSKVKESSTDDSDDDQYKSPVVKRHKGIMLQDIVGEDVGATSEGRNGSHDGADSSIDGIRAEVNGDGQRLNIEEKAVNGDNDTDNESVSTTSSDLMERIGSKDVDSDETDYEAEVNEEKKISSPLSAKLEKSCHFHLPSVTDDDLSNRSVTTTFELISDSKESNLLPGKRSGPQMKNIMSDSESSSDDEDAMQQLRNKVSNSSLEQHLSDRTNQDFEACQVYNPHEIIKEKWHGDVLRTVTMFNKTIQQMPMPSDDGNEDIKLPPGLVELYRHQKYGLRWMNWREGQFPGGGILADEMGLGKTIQIIALIMKSKWEASKTESKNEVGSWKVGESFPSRATLVVSPVSCIPQWCREIESKGKDLSVYTYHGQNKLSSAASLAKYDVVITTYQTISSEIPKQKETESPKPCYSPLVRVHWKRIVLDEAHYIRNPKTSAANAISQLEARHRWAVTGTPIHNKPEDFYSMCAFLKVIPFDDRSVWDAWIGLKHVNRGTDAEQRLHILGKALILRRTKDEIAASNDSKVQRIPPKTVEMISVELSNEERQVYDILRGYAQSILKEFLNQKEQREREKGSFASRAASCTPDHVYEIVENRPDVIKFSHIFALLIRMRQCAVLPHLIDTMLEADEIGVEEEDLEDLKPERVFSKKNPVFDSQYVSSKFQKIFDDVDELRDKAKLTDDPMDKVIIVSSWTSSLDIIFEHLRNKSYSCVFLTGRETMDLRIQNMDRFNKNRWRPQIMLLSLMAGGVGLNLVGANHVFFVEPHWNPQHERQAQDRAHRFGQKKDVFIRRYIAEDTIERRIMELQNQKLELADGLLSNTKKKGPGITLEQMKYLFDIYSHRDENN